MPWKGRKRGRDWPINSSLRERSWLGIRKNARWSIKLKSHNRLNIKKGANKGAQTVDEANASDFPLQIKYQSIISMYYLYNFLYTRYLTRCLVQKLNCQTSDKLWTKRRAGALVKWLWEMFDRSWVWIPGPYTRWTWQFFTLICCKICIVCLKRLKINQKEAEVGPFKKLCPKRSQKVQN